MNPRTARSVAAILSQTATDESLRALDQSDGRNQSEQASFLAGQSPFLRDIYERGGTVVEGVLTVPRENLSVSPEIEIATTHQAVERLTRITKDADKAKELAPQLVEMGTRIAGSHADGETRLKVFGWLYRALEGKQELLTNDLAEKPEKEQTSNSEIEFSEKWRQIVELSEAMAALEPKDRLPENSLEAFGENLAETEKAFESDENSNADFQGNETEIEDAERSEEFVAGGGLISFDRIEVGTDLPKIPENLSRQDFEKLLEKTSVIDSHLERGIKSHEILAPFKRYVELTRLDNELRLVEEEYLRTKIIGADKNLAPDYRLVAKTEELRELAADRRMLDALNAQKTKITENIRINFGEGIDREKVEQSIAERGIKSSQNSQIDAAKPEKIELNEDETEFRGLLVKEKNVGREIVALSESIGEREKSFRTVAELSAEEIPSARKNELIEKIVSLELPLGSVLKEKYPELTAQQRNEKAKESNTFEIRDAAEYLFVRDAAKGHFEILRGREIKNEFQKFETKNINEISDADRTRSELSEHRGKIQALKTLEPVFAYKIEGSNRIIKAKPSDRAREGYKFASDYVRYQLKQPETRLRHESALYRDFVLRLEAAKTAQDVVREAYKIRQENHRHAGLWKNSEKQEQGKLQKPLSKNEMTLLFLEQPPRSYSGEMSVLKYNFAHYTDAKQRMTVALQEGKLEPSRDAKKLAESLASRLARRDLETKHKATKHFFESLKTENEKLIIKNEFDHAGIYQKLPPHEKDWIYRRASEQKENLEYKIAFERDKTSARSAQIQTANLTVNESVAAETIRQEFATGTLWHQAAKLTEQKQSKNTETVAGLDEKLQQTIGFLIHNQSEKSNLRVGDWLDSQKSEQMKTAGEILKTFARATREIENNELTVTVNFNETAKVSEGDYKILFEKYFPADFERLKEFRANENEKFRLEQSRRDGQAALLGDWKKQAQSAIYRADAPVTVFENERRELQEIEKIKTAQIECRRALEVKNSTLAKYEEKLKKDLTKTNQKFSNENLRAAVEHAFAPEKLKTISPEQKAIFERAQDKVLISDFERFTTSAKSLEAGIIEINRSFEKIAALRLEKELYKFAPERTEQIESLQKDYEATQERAEAEKITSIAREKFAAKSVDAVNDTTLDQYLSSEERQMARVESHRQARVHLEPAELNDTQPSSEFESKALEFADALEDAHQKSLRREPESKIGKAFAVAEAKRAQMRESVKIEKDSLSPENKPITLLIYERELRRNEQAITRAKINEMVETGRVSLNDLETKKASEIFSNKERASIRLEAGERTRENLEPKELWAQRRDVSEKLQQTALRASEMLELAHEVYQDNANSKEISRAFSALDANIVRLKNERREERSNSKFINFKTDFKRDLAQMFESGKPVENPQMLAAMTKGLLLNALEKQNVQPEKIGLNSEKLSEISRTITLALADDKKREKMFAVNHKFNGQSVQDNRAGQTIHTPENQHIPVKTRQFEHRR